MKKEKKFWAGKLNMLLLYLNIYVLFILLIVQGYFYFFNDRLSIPISKIESYENLTNKYSDVYPRYGELFFLVEEEVKNDFSVLLNGDILSFNKNELSCYVKEGDLVEIISEEVEKNFKLKILDKKGNIRDLGNRETTVKNNLYEIILINLE